MKKSDFRKSIKNKVYEVLLSEDHGASLDALSDIILDLRGMQKSLMLLHPELVEKIGQATNLLEEVQNEIDYNGSEESYRDELNQSDIDG